MSHQVDERVVSMKFENEQFESGIKQSEQSVHSFNDSLNNLGKGQALNGIAVNVAAISDRFSALGIIGKRVLENLTDSAMAFISKTAHTVTDSIVQGGIRRAMNIESAHFMLQGLMQDEAKVQAIMNDAMESVTDTAYGYDVAAKAASMFAASGLEAGTQLQQALRGVAGTAATTNSAYEDISSIFTTIAGKGKVMTNELNMFAYRGLNAAVTIRDFLNGVNDGSIEASDSMKEAVKTITKGAQVTEESLREDLVPKSKISFEIFAAAMDNAFGDHAKKANETVTGAFANIKAALGRIGADFVSPLIVQNGPLVQVLNALRERINDVKAALQPMAEVFVSTVSTIAGAVTKYLQNLDVSKIAAPIEGIANKIRDVVTFIQSLGKLGALKNLSEAFMFTFRGIGKIIGEFKESFTSVFSGPTLYGVTKFAEGFKKLAAAFNVKIVQHLSQIKDVFSGLFSVLHIFGQAIGAVAKAFGSMASFVAPAGASILEFAAYLGRGITALDQFISKNKIFENFFSNIGKVIEPAAEKIKSTIGSIVDAIKGLGSVDDGTADGFSALGEKLNGASEGFTTFFNAIKTVGNAALSTVGRILSGLGAGLLGFLHNISLTDAVVTYFLSKTALNIKYLMYKLQPLNNIGDKIMGILGNTKTALVGFTRDIKAKALMHIAAAIALLAVALIGISSLDPTRLATSLLGIGAIMAELHGFMLGFTKIAGKLKGFVSVATSLMAFGIALLMIVGAMKVLASMSWEGIAKGLVGMAGALTAIAGAMQLMPSGAKMLAIGPSMIAVAAAMLIMSGALKVMGSMSIDSIGRSLLVLGGALAELAVGLHAMNGTLGGSAALVVAAAALMLLAPALKILGTMDANAITQSLIALAGALMVLSVAATAMKGSTASMAGVAASLGVLGASLMLLGPALKVLGTMSWESIAKGLATIAGALLELGVAGKLLSGTAPQMMLVAASLGVLGAALLIFVPGLAALGKLSVGTIVKGLVALAGTFAVLGIAGAVLGPLIPVMLGLSVAIGIFGAAVLAVGAGVALFGAGLTALAGLTAPALENIGNAIKSVISIIPELATSVAQGIVNVLQVLAANAPAVISAIITLLSELISQLATLVPQIAEVGLQMIIGLLTAIRDHIQEVVELGMEIITGFLRGIADHIEEVVDAGLDIVLGVIQGIAENAGQIATEAGHLVAEFIRGLGVAAKDIISAGADFVRNLGQGIRDHISAIGECVGDIVSGFIEGVSAAGERIRTAGKDAIIKFIYGLGDCVIEIANAATDVIVQFCEALGNNSELIMWAVSNVFTQIKSAFATEFPTLANFLGIEAETVSWTIPEHLAKGTYERRSQVTGAIDQVGAEMDHHLKNIQSQTAGTATATGTSIDTNTASGVTGSISAVTGAVQNMGNQVASEVSSQGGKYEQAGNTSGAQTGPGTASGIQSGEGHAKAAATNFGNAVRGVINGLGPQLDSAGYSSGQMAGAGLARGIANSAGAVAAAAAGVAARAKAAMQSVLQEHSPSRVTQRIGEFFTLGFANGITRFASKAEKSSKDLSNRVIDAAKKTLKIESPSKVARDEIGNYIVEGIAEGIEANTSAEDAAAKKAQNIINAFKTELDKADLTSSIQQLEYDIWTALNPDADDDTKNKKALEMTMKDLESQTERVNLLLGRVAVTKKEFGENSEEFREAYNDLLKEIKTYAESISSLKQLSNSLTTSEEDLNKAMVMWQLQNQDAMIVMKEKMKMTEDQIRDYIMDQVGGKKDNSYAMAVKTALSDYEQFITTMNEALKTGNLALMDQFKAGDHYAALLAASVAEGGQEVKAASDQVADSSVTAVQSKDQEMYKAGESLMGKLTDSITTEGMKAVAAAQKVANAIANTLQRPAIKAETASTTFNDQTGVITPIVDSAKTKSSFVSKGTMSIDKAAITAGTLGKDIKAVGTSGDSDAKTTVNYSITQNNNSPKALSSAEIYRKTKTLLGQMKNTTTAATATKKGATVSA